MDKIPGTLSVAAGGIERGLRHLREATHEIAAAPAHPTEPTPLVEPVVRALEAQRAVEASANVVRRTDDMLDALLEALA
jgi:hypothetical protein